MKRKEFAMRKLIALDFLASLVIFKIYYRRYIEEHGQIEFNKNYPARDVRPRELLAIRDTKTRASEKLYAKKLRSWQSNKKEQKAKDGERELDAKIAVAWESLDEGRLLELALQYEANLGVH
jgi:hypothetical protein